MTPKNLYFRGFGAAVNHDSVAASTTLVCHRRRRKRFLLAARSVIVYMTSHSTSLPRFSYHSLFIVVHADTQSVHAQMYKNSSGDEIANVNFYTVRP